MIRPGFLILAVLVAGGCPVISAATAWPRYDHIVVVIEENHAFDEILGPGRPAPYLRSLAVGGVTFVRSFAVTHPSQPNYLALFSGSTQGTTNDSLPHGLPFTTPNLGAELFAHGLSFIGFSQQLPALGFNGEAFSPDPAVHRYMRKHNPWVNWQAATPGSNQLPPWTNLPFEQTFPTQPAGDFSVLPTVAFVIPDERYDMHDGSIAAADGWLRDNLSAYADWAVTHNSLLIVTFDEDDASQGNQIATVLYGAHLRPGRYAEIVNHYSVLRLIEDIHGLGHVGASATARPITDIFTAD